MINKFDNVVAVHSLLSTKLLKRAIDKTDPTKSLVEIKAAVAELGQELVAQAQKNEPESLVAVVEGVEGLMRQVVVLLEENLRAAEEHNERQWFFEIQRDQDGLISTITAV